MIEGNTSQPLLVRRRKASRGPRTMTRAEAFHRDLRGLQIAPQSSGCGATLLVNMRDIEPRKEDDGFDGAFLSP